MNQRVQSRLDVSPIGRSRNRQFSQIRQGHSQRPNASAITTERMTPTPRPQNKQSNLRTSQFNHNKSQLSQSPSKTLCVGCFNKQLYQARLHKKQQDINRDKELTNSSLINADDTNHIQAKSRYNRQLQLTNQYNKQKMLKNREKRERQRQEKQKSVVVAQNDIEEIKQQQRRKAERQHDRVQQLRRELQEQIQLKKLKQQVEKNQKKEPSVAIFGQPNRQNIQQQIQQKYRKDLKDQIQQNKQLRSKLAEQQNQRKKQIEQRIFQEAAQRQRIRKQQTERRQRQIQQDTRKQRRYQQEKEERRKMEELQRQNQIKDNYNAFVEEKKHKQEIKKNKLDRYIGDLKKQMATNEEKKRREYNWLNQPTRSALIDKDPVPERACDSCEKKYPEPYLTKINQPLRL